LIFAEELSFFFFLSFTTHDEEDEGMKA